MPQPSGARPHPSARPSTASPDRLRSAIAAIAPYIEDNALGWDQLQTVLDSMAAENEIRSELISALGVAGITVRGLPARVGVASPETARSSPRPSATGTRLSVTQAQSDALAMSAARRLMGQDTVRSRLDNRLLTAEEEVGLGLIIQSGSTEKLPQGSMARLTGERRRAAETLYLHNTRLAWSVAQKYVGQGLELDDLAQWALVGLVRAVELFDPRSGNKFSTYATWWLRQAVTRAIADEGRLIRVPVHMHERIQRVWRIREEMSQDGIAPRLPELAKACDLTPKQVIECLILRLNIRSLDEPVGDNGVTLGDLLDLPDRASSAYDLLVEDLRRTQIHAVLDTLSEREAGVITGRNGLDDDVVMSLDAIGKVYGVTRERIRQIEEKTMEKLRDPAVAEILRPYL